jgi:hypothetical protein
MPSGEKPSSALFLRRDCILSTLEAKVFIPQECATGVQLRSASVLLLRAVIRGHSNPFFDAEGSTPIGKNVARLATCIRGNQNSLYCTQGTYVHM